MAKSRHVTEIGKAQEALPPAETPWTEFRRIFSGNRLSVAGVVVLILLLITAVAGKATTEWMVVFVPGGGNVLVPLPSVALHRGDTGRDNIESNCSCAAGTRGRPRHL